ncbi:hypothetical protein SSX86_020755 [Deinandra increscens subsp. villosa]|uniref:Replication factor A C-terminal domain-containing protein n=1 Tax=Deinandra increscens subsp. villosa TaxID=3103831 RepID=A0AAP0CPW6_9ASTR
MLALTSISINRPPILSSLSDRTNPPESKPKVRLMNTTIPPQPPSGKQPMEKKPSVAEIERAIGAGVFKDRDINRESEQEKTMFDQILSNSIGKTEGDVEKKLRETGEWIIDQTEGPSRSTGKNILKAVFLWILPLWILSFLVVTGVIKLPFISPFLDDLIMGNNVYLTLWNTYANQMRLYVYGHLDEPFFIVIVQFGRVKFYKGNPYVSNSFGDVVSKIFINSDIHDITEYKKRLNENPSATHRPFGLSMFISPEDDFLIYTDFCNIAEICDINKKKHVILLGTIKAICKDVGWHYMGCKKCTRKLQYTYEIRVKEDGSDMLDLRKFKIQIRVQDVTGVVSLTLFDRDASRLIEKSAADLLDIYGEDKFPEEINSLVEKRFAFKIEITEYNFKNNYQVYGVSALLDDSSVVSKLDKKFNLGQASDSDFVHMSMSDLPSFDQVAMKDTLSGMDDNLTPLSNASHSISTARLTVGKSSSMESNDSLLKHKLDDIFDVDESPMTSSSKSVAGFISEKPTGDVGVKLLNPKVEK